MRRLRCLALAVSVVIVAVGHAAPTAAQEPVEHLQDLVGARGSSGELALQQRGYETVGGEKSSDASYTYWRHGQTGACIIVRTADGRYASLVEARPLDCERFENGQESTAADGPGEFETICGFMAGHEPQRYLCTAEVFHDDGGNHTRTILRFPDMEMSLNWQGGGEVGVHLEGMNPQRVEFVTYEGETNFTVYDKTYFFISNRSPW